MSSPNFIVASFDKLQDAIELNGKDKIIDELNDQFELIDADFPLKKYFEDDMPNEKFQNVLSYVPKISNEPYKLVNIKDISGNFFKKYYNKFRNKFIKILSFPDDYENVNILPDYFNELPRVQSIGKGHSVSPYDMWKNKDHRRQFISYLIDREQDINPKNMREAIYKVVSSEGKAEARLSKITTSKGLMEFFHSVSILDPSSAYGDRLIAALSTKTVQFYTGIDPNPDLRKGYSEIKRILFPKIPKEWGKKKEYFTTITGTFVPIPKLPTGDRNIYSLIEPPALPEGLEYDLCIISPPHWEGEIYSSSIGQSTVPFKTFNEWFSGFMIPYIAKACSFVCNGGFLAITILDRETPITELTLLCIEIFGDNMGYEGVVAWTGDSGKPVPYWIWRKKRKDGFVKKKNVEEALNIIKTRYNDDIYQRVFGLTIKRPWNKSLAKIIKQKISFKNEKMTIDQLFDLMKQDDIYNFSKELEDKYPDFFSGLPIQRSEQSFLKRKVREILYDLELILWRKNIIDEKIENK